MRKKVSIVGAGNVGATTAHWIAAAELADVVLIDIIEGVPQGKGLDLLEAMPVQGSDSAVLGTNDYADTANSDIVVITAGMPRKPGMSRDDLLNINYKIMQDVVGNVVKYSPKSILIIVSNPLDAMAQAAYKLSGFPRKRVIGMAGVLDQRPLLRLHRPGAEGQRGERDRLRARRPRRHHGSADPLLHRGGHSGHRTDRQADPRPPGAAHPRRRRRDREAAQDRQRLLRAGGAPRWRWSRPSCKDKKKILPCAVYLEGEYGIKGLFVGVPAKLGAGGIEQVIEIKLSDGRKRRPEEERRRGQGAGGGHRTVGNSDSFVSKGKSRLEAGAGFLFLRECQSMLGVRRTHPESDRAAAAKRNWPGIARVRSSSLGMVYSAKQHAARRGCWLLRNRVSECSSTCSMTACRIASRSKRVTTNTSGL